MTYDQWKTRSPDDERLDRCQPDLGWEDGDIEEPPCNECNCTDHCVWEDIDEDPEPLDVVEEDCPHCDSGWVEHDPDHSYRCHMCNGDYRYWVPLVLRTLDDMDEEDADGALCNG